MTNFWDDLIFGPNRMGKNYKNLSDEYPNTDPYNLSPNLQKTVNKIKDYNLFGNYENKKRNNNHHKLKRKKR
ncbi:hypothetical protein QMA02_30690 [Bacillus wiedmannii]|uniref:hypothetical protein n=1 Tax=Bacillus wiedmannii TaxID=1890302 RepID=UPI0024ACC104|nr:hypothetical protein [Bacillus wiedmannii]MDI6680121.1 hypothetical protein [Bacillus wiedmannii]MED2839113.1 hypothetical protein [Bacillus wiedmannii]